jgi:hypothetical protein
VIPLFACDLKKILLFLKKKKQKDFLPVFSEWAVPQALPNE